MDGRRVELALAEFYHSNWELNVDPMTLENCTWVWEGNYRLTSTWERGVWRGVVRGGVGEVGVAELW